MNEKLMIGSLDDHVLLLLKLMSKSLEIGEN